MTEENKRGKRSKLKIIKVLLNSKVIWSIVIVLAIVVGTIGVSKMLSFDNKTTKLGFENIGELATQTAYCTEVNVTETSRELFGVEIPFTQSKYIYSYDIVIKAGYDFDDIKWKEKDAVVIVKLPKVKILSSEINLDSFKIYHEDESIFRQITMKENSKALKELKKTAEKDAIENGLLDNARSNAETILTSFFANEYDLEKYKIKFVN